MTTLDPAAPIQELRFRLPALSDYAKSEAELSDDISRLIASLTGFKQAFEHFELEANYDVSFSEGGAPCC